MSKLYCAYGKDSELADHKCDFCGKLLCRVCGYVKNGKDYCNECWQMFEDEKLGQIKEDAINSMHRE